MIIKQRTTVLSLAVLIAFGISSCSAGESSGVPASTQTQVAPAETSSEQAPEESVRLEAIATMNKAHELKSSDEFMSFYNQISAVDYTATGDLSEAADIFKKNSALVDKYEALVGYSDANKDYVVNMLKAYGGKETLPDEDTLRRMLEISAFTEENTHTEKVEGELSYNIFPDMVQEKDGKFFVTGDYVYTKDENNAVINFPFSEKEILYLEDGGKKIVMDTPSEEAPTKPGGWYILQADVKNAATSIEYWIVDQKGTKSDLVVENDSIVSGFPGKNKDHYTFKLDEGTTLKVSGNSYEYTITGNYAGLEEEVVYDSAKGGLQPSKVVSEEKAEPKPEPGAVYTLWDDYAEKVYRSESGLLPTDNEYSTIETTVEKLNKTTKDAVTYDITEKNGKEYIKVTVPKLKNSDAESLLWVYDRTVK